MADNKLNHAGMAFAIPRSRGTSPVEFGAAPDAGGSRVYGLARRSRLMQNGIMSKKRPRTGRRPARLSAPAGSKMEPEYWRGRLFKSSYTYNGRRFKVRSWLVKISIWAAGGRPASANLFCEPFLFSSGSEFAYALWQQGLSARIKMAKHGNKQFRRAALVSQAHRPPSVIPGLGVDVPELQQARRLWQLNRFDEALALFEQAVRKYPQNLVALVDASRALGARFEITRAEEMLDRLAKLAAHNPQLMHLAGQSYRMIFRPEKAIQCFERVLAMTQGIPDAQLELAVLYERRHRVAEAYSLIEDCLRAEPDYLEALLFKARLLRRLKDAAGAEAIFRSLAAEQRGAPNGPRPGLDGNRPKTRPRGRL